MGPKMQDFAQESTCSKEIVLKQSWMNYGSSQSAKLYFQSQFFMSKIDGIKKDHLWISI